VTERKKEDRIKKVITKTKKEIATTHPTTQNNLKLL
jgi:hypothetical protein